MTSVGESRKRDAIDVARVLALFIVVLGHLLLAVIDREDGVLRGANLLDLERQWAWLAVLAPMPVFFAAAGWANATSTVVTTAPRVRRLVGVGCVVLCGWSLAVVVTDLITGDPGVVGDGARVATQPLWFLAAYVPLAAAAGPIARVAQRNVLAVVGGALGVLAVLDFLRFGLDLDWVGWPGFFLAWGTPWALGAWWRSRWEGAGFDERRAGLALVAGAGAACVVLVAAFDYSPGLIDAIPGRRSNTTPPTLYTAVAAVAQVGLLMLLAPALDRAGRRWRRLWDSAGEAAVGVYVWHLTALALCAAVISAGLPVPERLTGLWWATRPVWWLVVLTLTLGFVVGTARLSPGRRAGSPSRARAVLGVVATAAGAATVGLRGPRTVGLALICCALLLSGWRLLGTQNR